MEDKIANFAPWLKYYDAVYRLMSQMMMEIKNGMYESALMTGIMWHDSLDLDEDNKCNYIEKKYQSTLKKCNKQLEKSKKQVFLNNNKLDKIELDLLEMHRLLQKGMYKRGMKYTEKEIVTEFDPEDFKRKSDLA